MKVMGIVNVTPDSFSDGGKYYMPEEAVRRAVKLLAEGADVIDFGAESTRPGATALTWQEEWERLEPVLELFFKKRDKGIAQAAVSVDTYHPETAERSLALGVKMINCVYAEKAPEMISLCAKTGSELIVPASVCDPRLEAIPHYLDPMIGFGTTREEDLSLLKSLPELAKRGKVAVGVSRKRIVQKLTGEKVLGKNLGGNLALALWCAEKGVSLLRVHEVKETVQALQVYAAMS